MDISDKFRKAFSEESDYPLTDDLLGYILDHSSMVKVEKGCPIIDFGDTNPDIYIIYEGIARGYMQEDGVETNLYFGMEGTFVASMQPFWDGSPSIIRIEQPDDIAENPQKHIRFHDGGVAAFSAMSDRSFHAYELL